MCYGSEYRWAEFVKDALTLTGLRCFAFGEDERNLITRAQAYNAAAKGLLEGSFRVFEETLVKVLPGYLGGNRLSSRRANVGKAPEPWPGTFEMFVSRIEDLIRYWMTRARQGDLKGKSPQQKLAEYIAAGWNRTDVDPYALAVAFSTEAERQVVDGKVSAPGGKYYCDALIPYTGQRVGVRIPKYQSWDAVPVFALKSKELIGVARLERAVDRLDPAGAEEAARRKKAALATIRDKAATVQPTDIGALMAASGRRQALPPEPKSGGRIEMADALATAGRQLAETTIEQHDREHTAKQAQMRERLALARTIQLKVKP